jgi:predicted TIM-barrel fold metal-dependent hydrolase
MPVSFISNDSFFYYSQCLDSVVLLQVYVKLSAFFRVSREPFPYKDTWQILKQLLDTYGADRLMWGRLISNHEMEHCN